MSKTLPLALVLLSAAAASADSAKPPPPASLYRLDISITGLDPDPKAAPATYSVMAEEDHRATLSTSSNIPLQSGSKDAAVPRMDVGVKLTVEYRHFDASTIVVEGDIEISAVEQASPTTVHRVRVEGATAVTSGAAQLASVYDNQSHRRYDISITAHKIL
jgi:hypothetical protein